MSTPASGPSAPRAPLGERELIARIRERFPAPPDLLPVGIGDDAAVATPPRGALEILTTDALVEGVHFDRSFCSLRDVGYKALAVNVSDVASMGGTPRLALLSLMLPTGLATGEVDALLDGFAEMAGVARVTLAGGNITRSPGPLVVDVCVVGSVRRRKVLTRAGGRPGDLIYVTGQVGAAAAGLGWLRARPTLEHAPDSEMDACVQRYRRPEPRTRLGAALGTSGAASACMDLSDGLADAVRQVAEASGTGASIDAATLPLPDAAAEWFASQGADPVHAALTGGDDYELLFTVPGRSRGRLRHVLRHAQGVAVTRIGVLTPGSTTAVVRDGHAEPLPHGFVHF